MVQLIKVKIVGIETITEYMDFIYDQNIVVELQDGIQFGIFNGGKILTNKFLNKEVKILLEIPVLRIKKVNYTQQKIIPSSINPLNHQNHLFEGILIKKGIKDQWHKVSPSNNLAVVNVGVGDVLLDVDTKKFSEINEGDYVQITALRTDLLDIQMI